MSFLCFLQLPIDDAYVAAEDVGSEIVMEGCGYDIEYLFSNGTNSSPASDSFHIKLVNSLVRVFPDEKITSCQQYPGAPYERRMCGSENVQGRHVNGSANACTQNAELSSDRLLGR